MITIKTRHGDIKVELFDEKAPISCQNFRQYIEDGFFSDTIFHREIMNGGPAWDPANTVWREESPASFAGDFRTPIMLTIGELDYRVPINQTIAAWSYVQRMQVPGRLLVFHDADHWIMKGEEARYYWEEAHAFLAKHLQ